MPATLQKAPVSVERVMTRDVVSAPADASLMEALELMEENHVSALPVVDRNGKVIGILSASDLIELARQIEADLSDIERLTDVSRLWLIEQLEEHRLGRSPVQEHMCDSVATIRAQASVRAAARAMLKKKVHRLPVVDRRGRLVGIVSTTDLLRALVRDA